MRQKKTGSATVEPATAAQPDGSIQEHVLGDPLLMKQALHQAVFNSTKLSKIATDAQGLIQIFNAGAERMLGYLAAEVVHHVNLADIFDPKELLVLAKALSIELNTRVPPGFETLVFKAHRGIEETYELNYIRKDGSRFPAVISVIPLRDPRDEVIGYLLISTDNTERKRLEDEQNRLDQRLRDQQFYTRSLIESSIDALMTTDPKGYITDVNRQMEQLTGCTRDELIGAPFKRYFTDPDSAQAGIDKVLRETKVANYELVALSREGVKTLVSYNASTFYDRDRQLLGVFAAARDITAQKHASQYARSLLEASLDPLVTISLDGKITDVNEATVKATGVAREELVSSDFSNYFTEPDKARKGYQRVFADGFVADYPLTIQQTSGNLIDVLYNASVYKDVDGNVLGVFAAARDITAQKQASQYARSLLEASLDPLVTISLDGKITDVNEATVKATGV
ncbi:MAG: PAS domain-containing protein, partial [Rhodoferax sp.]|nr:PAS domain-containing protein [Rhodoferax sp.]